MNYQQFVFLSPKVDDASSDGLADVLGALEAPAVGADATPSDDGTGDELVEEPGRGSRDGELVPLGADGGGEAIVVPFLGPAADLTERVVALEVVARGSPTMI